MLSQWVLILIVAYAGESVHTNTVTFTSPQKCEAAKNAVLSAAQSLDQPFAMRFRVIATCAQQ